MRCDVVKVHGRARPLTLRLHRGVRSRGILKVEVVYVVVHFRISKRHGRTPRSHEYPTPNAENVSSAHTATRLVRARKEPKKRAQTMGSPGSGETDAHGNREATTKTPTKFQLLCRDAGMCSLIRHALQVYTRFAHCPRGVKS